MGERSGGMIKMGRIAEGAKLINRKGCFYGSKFTVDEVVADGWKLVYYLQVNCSILNYPRYEQNACN